MVRKTLNILFFLLGSISIFSQNLVKNSGFEEYIRLPKYINEPVDVFFAKDWTHVYRGTISSVDYIYYIDSNTVLPNNYTGAPTPISGNAFVGIAFFGGLDYLEFITGTLTTPLEKDKKYLFSIKLRQSNYNILYLSKLEVSFENDSSLFILKDSAKNYDVFSYGKNSRYGKIFKTKKKRADIVLDNIPFCSDTSLWFYIEQEYIAKGGEKYITLGLFYQGKRISRKITKLNNEVENSPMSVRKRLKTILKYKIPFIKVNKEFKITDKMTLGSIACIFFIDDVSITEITKNK